MRSAARLLLGVLAALVAIAGAPVRAQDWLILEGLADGEAYDTTASGQLSRNGGDAAGVGRLTLWTAMEAHRQLHFFAMGEFEYHFEDGGESETELEQLFLRYSAPTRHPLSLEAGRLTSPVGAFTRRHLSYLNPLVGAPYTYGVSYPDGIKLYGSAAAVDYHVAYVNLPVVNDYTPEPTPAYRPALGLGVTPFTGFRLGASYTSGPYLNDHLGVAIAPNEDWKSFDQSVIGAELQFSRGYVEVNAEFVRSSYEVPMEPREARGKSYYVDLKYTVMPRLYVAARVGHYDNPYIRPTYLDYWGADGYRFVDAELGVGFRATRGTLVKVSYRHDWWKDDMYGQAPFEDGSALAFQVSHRFDIKSWFDGPR